MNYRIRILSVFVPLCLFLCFMSNTYSRYVADTTGNLKMSFAQWQILVNNDDITSNSTSSVTLNPIINENKYVENDKLAPSSSGYFDISIDPSNVDVAFDYSIALTILNEDIPDLTVSEYAILDKNYSEGNTITYKPIENNIIKESVEFEKIATSSDEIVTGSDELINYSFEPFIVRIYFKWYEGTGELMNDEDDSKIVTSGENIDFEIKAEIKFEQKLNSSVN